MAPNQLTLDYYPTGEPLVKLTLEEADGVVRVIFPVAPLWTYIVGIAVPATAGVIVILGMIAEIWMLRGIFYRPGFPSPPPSMALRLRAIENKEAISAGIYAVIMFVPTVYKWMMLRRWGRVPRVLSGDSNALNFSRLGWLGMRERRWQASDISSIELRPVKWNLTWKRTVADLYIRRRKRMLLFFRLSSTDPQLPRLIAEKMAMVLGCPLT
jgi:hypothetical protein